MYEYEYSVANDTLNGTVNPALLETEVRASTITVALSSIHSSGDELCVDFKAALSTQEETDLDALVAAHDGTIETLELPEEIRVVEEDPNNKTAGGHYRCKGFDHSVPVSSPVGDITYSDFSFPYMTALLDFKFNVTPEMEGDYISVIFAPDMTIGAIGADVAVDDSTFTVSSTVLDNIEIGFTFILDDGTNHEVVGEVVSIDSANSTVTVDGSAVNTFLAATPTLVKMEVKAVDRVRLSGSAGVFAVGDEKIGGSPMPAEVVFRFLYENNEGSAKEFTGLLGFLY